MSGEEATMNGQETLKEYYDGLWGVQVRDGLYGVLEKVTNDNYDDWIAYFKVQSNPRVSGIASSYKGGKVQKGTLSDGAGYGLQVIENVNFKNNVVYVAYLTTNFTPTPVMDTMKNDRYSADDVHYVHRGVWQTEKEDIQYWLDTRDTEEGHHYHSHKIARDIKMYVTITTSNDARITSHMGIAATAESVLTGRPKNVSALLHGFAAHCMLTLYTNKCYMVTVPVPMMTSILAKALQSNLHYGTTNEKETEVSLRDKEYFLYKMKINLDKFWDKHPPKITVDDILNPSKFIIKMDDECVPELEILKTNPAYEWLFLSIFSGSMNRHIIVNLQNLNELWTRRNEIRDDTSSDSVGGAGVASMSGGKSNDYYQLYRYYKKKYISATTYAKLR